MGYPETLINSWVPNLPLISAVGELKEKDNYNNKILNISGKGILEFLLVEKKSFKERRIKNGLKK
ncbi:MAG: hypothetical protein ACYDIA_18720 [Candidatus Humimicrobiaceae bacterium]